MTKRKVSMNKLREILRLKETCGLTLRKTSKAMGLSRPVVTEYFARCAAQGLDYATARDMPDDDLETLLKQSAKPFTYIICLKLFAHLKTARADGSFPREMKLLAKQDLVILDDFGLKQLDSDSRLFLLELLEDRSGIKSTVISSQVPVTQWFDIIGDPTISDAICDRVIHTAHTLQLKGPSMRKQKWKNSGQNLPSQD